MKIPVLISAMVLAGSVHGQTERAPLSEARKAMMFMENEEERLDSLRRTYRERWSLNVTYGQRYIDQRNKTTRPDTITFIDFSDRRSFYGIGTSYFVSPRLNLNFGVDFSILPRNQEILNFSFGGPNGLSGQARGNGGVLLGLNLGVKYFFRPDRYTRPYIGGNVGVTNLIAKGGEIQFNSQNGREDDINTVVSRVNSGQVVTGVSFRISPVVLLDYQAGYNITTKTSPIGGVTSTGGFSSTISLQFILNPRKSK